MKTTTKVRLPRLARILKRYLKLLDSDAIQRLGFMERSRLKGMRIGQLRAELDRMESRRGQTLIEAMMALLVFTLGAVPLMSLFAISTIRTAEATRKTTAASIAENADAILDLYPTIAHNPDRNPFPAVHFGETFVFDPLGFVLSPSASQATFGPLTRYPGDWRVAATAWELCGTEDRKYSWVATIRHNGIGDAQPSIVVFSGRGFDPADETQFPAVFKVGSQTVTLTAPAGRAKRGKWIFEAPHGRWYQIANVSEQGSGSGTQVVTLESPAIDDGSVAMLLPDIVDVFPIHSK